MNKKMDLVENFWMQSWKPAKRFAGIRNDGLILKDRFAVFASCRFHIVCFIVNCLIVSKLSQSFISAGVPAVGKIA